MQDCKRKANYVYMFPYSEYETKVDVGICVGQCGNRTGISMEKLSIHHTETVNYRIEQVSV